MYFLILALFISPCYANFDWNKFETSTLQVGNWLENFAQVRGTRSDETNGFEFAPFISAASAYKLNERHLLIPELGWVIQRTENDIRKNQFFARLDYAFALKPWLRLRAGSSFMILMQSADGGEDVLNNGNTTETYFIPPERRNTYNQTLDLGVEFIQKELSARFQTYNYAPLNEDQRLTTLSFSLNYNFPTKDLF